MIKRPELGLKLNDEWFSVNDVVEIKYSEYTVKNNLMEFPYCPKVIKGRIVCISESSIKIDHSENYESYISFIDVGTVFEISKLK